MARTFTVAELATKVRQRGDYENSGFITNTLLIDFIDSAHTEVYDLLVTKWEDYYVKEVTFVLTEGSSSYTLPDDFYKLLGVDIQDSGNYYRLKRYGYEERNRNTSGIAPNNTYRYRLQGGAIKFIPAPASADTLRLTYIPIASKLTALTDTVDGVNGWEELVVLFALRRCLQREESSVTTVDAEIARQINRMEVAADARDAGDPESLSDYCRTEELW